MTLSTSTASQTFPGNGVTQIFPCGFRIFQAPDISVSLVNAVTGVSTPLVLNSDYTLTGEGNQTGFTLSTSVPVATGTNLLVARNIAYTQPTDFTNQGSFFPTMHEDCADRLGMQIQQLAGSIQRTLQLPDGIYPVASGTLPYPSPLAPLVWNAAGNGLDNGSTSMTGDMLLRGNLASTSAGKGSSLVAYLTGTVKSFLDSLSATGSAVGSALIGFIHSGVGAVGRTMQDKMRDTINVLDYGAKGDGVTDDTVNIQKAMTAAAGKTLMFPPLTFLVSSGLLVSSATTIYAYGATIKRSGTADNLLRNNADGVSGGYNANANITVLGGTWDSTTGTGDCTVIAFGHCSNVVVRDVIVNNVNNWHHIEVNGSYNVTIDNCTFTGGNVSTYAGNNEAIQIDSLIGSGEFPWFGPYDNSICQTVRVLNCTFSGVGSGVGTHTATTSINHNSIIVDNCYFKNVWASAVKGLTWSDVKVTNNKFDTLACAVIFLQNPTGRINNDICIYGNSITGIGTVNPTDSRGIWLMGTTGQCCSNVTIAHNRVITMTGANATHGIYAEYAQNISIANNTVQQASNGVGIYVFGGSYISVTGNMAGACQYDYRFGNTSVAGSLTKFVATGNTGDIATISFGSKCFVRGNNFGTSFTNASMTSSDVTGNLVAGVVV